MLTRKTALRSKTQLKATTPKTSKIRQSAKGEHCLVRVPGVCNGNPATTVLAHLNGAGIGCKHSDHKAAYACSACHSWLDGGYVQSGYGRTTRDLWHLESVIRTQDRLINKGLIQVTGGA
ncbi:nuclease domain-containing protein [Marinobacter sp. KMM 10035]|uniref:nuclease domain-containing protein n=1 Tax=Marinobacter sp. KMM 10035 TaxID=3134034 RepID=UPI00397B5C8D